MAAAWGVLWACAVDDRAVGVAGGAPATAAMGGTSPAGSDAGGSGGTGSASMPGGAGGLDGNAADDSERDGGAGEDGSSLCTVVSDCDGNDPCATFDCRNGACVAVGRAPVGTACGSPVDDACTDPDSCDAQGVCRRNDEIATACEGGTCSGGLCITAPSSGCAVDIVSSVPFMTSWSSVGRPDLYDGGCDSLGTPEYALVFTAPQAATYRITSAALVDTVPYTGAGDASGIPNGPADGDSVMTVVRGNCAGVAAQQRECNDDVAPGTLNSGLDLALDAGEVVTVYLNELTQTGGGTGTVAVSLLP